MRATTILAFAALGLFALSAPSRAYTFTTLDVPDGNNTIAYGINDAGQIVGSFAGGNSVPGSTDVHGFFYSDGKFSQIDVPGGTYTEAFGINNAGQIVGWYQIDGFAQLGFADTSGGFSPFRSVRSTGRLTV